MPKQLEVIQTDITLGVSQVEQDQGLVLLLMSGALVGVGGFPHMSEPLFDRHSETLLNTSVAEGNAVNDDWPQPEIHQLVSAMSSRWCLG